MIDPPQGENWTPDWRGSDGARIRPTAGFVRFDREEIEQSIPERFEAQVEIHRHRLAVKTPHYELDYAALNRWANCLAHALIAACGTEPAPVALLLDKDAPHVVAIIGVLKAGKFYVPLAKTHPPARNAWILEDSRSRLIVTDGANLATARRLGGETTAILNVDAIDPQSNTDDPCLDIPPDAHAYILYTSGSTGRPKGVVESHRNVLHNIMNFTNDHYVHHDDRITGLNSFAFSGSLKDLFGSLLNGAALFPIEFEQVGLHALAPWLVAQKISIFSAVSTTFRHFARSLTEGQSFPGLRVIRIGSEEVTWKDVELFKAWFPADCVLVNGYGATETGTVRSYVIDHRTEPDGIAVPVGYPVEGMDVLLLDEAGDPVGFDQIGQIAVRSAYLSAGYWRQPELTLDSFLNDPDGGDRRIYLTGDLGVMHPDGCLIHVGRKDFQVKVRGHRVEVAEVEAALRAHPGVAEAIVVARSEIPEDHHLVAYVVPLPSQAAAPSTPALRAFLRGRLPDASIPAAFVWLEGMPLTSTGKVDRRALPAPDLGREGCAREFVGARTELEGLLIEIWEGLTGVRPIGVVDDFFEIGGNSLLAVRMFAEIHKSVGKRLPFETLVSSPTIERLAEIVSGVADATARPLMIALKAGGSRAPFFGIPGSLAHPLTLYELARRGDPDQPFFGLQYPEPSRGSPYPTRIEDLAARFLPELLKIQPQGPYRLGGHSFGGIIALELAQQLIAQGREVALLALFDTWGKGYPTLLPIPGRIIDHLRHLRTLPPREKFQHLSRRAVGVLKKIASRLRFRAAEPPPYLASPSPPDPSDPATDIGMINHLAWRHYRPRAYPGRLVLFRSSQSPSWIGSRFDDPYLGWKDLATVGIEIHEVPGDHLTLLDPRNVETLARGLDAYLRC